MGTYFYYILCKREWNESQYEWMFPEKNYIFFKVKGVDWKDAENDIFETGISLYGNCPEIPFKVRQISEATYSKYKIYKDKNRIDNEFRYLETHKSTLPVYIKPEIIIRKTPESYTVSETTEIIDFFNETNKLKNYNDD